MNTLLSNWLASWPLKTQLCHWHSWVLVNLVAVSRFQVRYLGTCPSQPIPEHLRDDVHFGRLNKDRWEMIYINFIVFVFSVKYLLMQT
jgi:hypothetical protein